MSVQISRNPISLQEQEYNPLYYTNEWDNSSETFKFQGSETLTAHITEDLTAKTIFSYDYTDTKDHIYYSANHFNGSSDKGKVHEMSTGSYKVVSSSTLNYVKDLGEKHSINLLAGFEAEKNETKFQRATGSNLPASSLPTVATAGVLDASAYSWGNSMVSVLSKAEYNYDGRYYISGSFRRDGSSRLSEDARWGNFWSVAGSWKINNEEFMKGIDWISNLRIRASYGINGTLPSGNYGWRSLASFGSPYNENPGALLSTVADANLSWETSYNTNVAIEAGFWDQRFYTTIEYFNRDSKDLLQDVPISTVTGFSSTLKNVGEVNNKGLEIEVGGGIGTEHGVLVLGIVQILLAYHIRLHGSCEACHIKSEEGGSGKGWRECDSSSTYHRILSYPIPVVLVVVEIDVLVVVEDLVA